MTGYVLSPRVRADLDHIWAYTAERWGIDQAEHYLRTIQTAFESVAAKPERGHRRDDVRPGYRCVRAGSHLIFYRVVVERVEIVRILHGRMDVGNHL